MRSSVTEPLDAALLKYEFRVPVCGLPARLCSTDIVRMLVDLQTNDSHNNNKAIKLSKDALEMEPHPTQSRSFQRWSSQPITWLILS